MLSCAVKLTMANELSLLKRNKRGSYSTENWLATCKLGMHKHENVMQVYKSFKYKKVKIFAVSYKWEHSYGSCLC